MAMITVPMSTKMEGVFHFSECIHEQAALITVLDKAENTINIKADKRSLQLLEHAISKCIRKIWGEEQEGN
jgi:hypothetical protein